VVALYINKGERREKVFIEHVGLFFDELGLFRGKVKDFPMRDIVESKERLELSNAKVNELWGLFKES